MSELTIPRELLEDEYTVSDAAIRSFLGASATATISFSKDTASLEARHKIWLSYLPKRFTLFGKRNDKRSVAVATGKAISKCIKTLDKSGRHTLLDGSTVWDLYEQREKSVRAFRDRVVGSMPAKIILRMIPAGEGLSSPDTWAHLELPDHSDRYGAIASTPYKAFGSDSSEFRRETIEHILLKQLGLTKDGRLKVSWPIDESLEMYREAEGLVNNTGGSQ